MSMGGLSSLRVELFAFLENFCTLASGSTTRGNPGKMYLCRQGITRFAPIRTLLPPPDGYGRRIGL